MRVVLLFCSAFLLSSAGALVLAQTAARPNRAAAIQDLVIANHILANEGVVDAFGHVSIRDPANPNRFLIARSVAPGSVVAADILEFDLDSKAVVANPPALYSERFIHGEIYKVRPDVMAVVHCHAPEVIPFSVTGVPLRAIVHVGGFLGDGIPVFEIRDADGITDMLVSNTKRGSALARTLGSKPAALMRGHGAVVTSDTLHSVVGRAYYMNFNARLQYQAMQMGGTVKYLDPEEARLAAPQNGFERAWDFWKQRAGGK
jgi:ribulose-5-phosphate 4-epimerase/fuculose-1-phosphate aldolase